MSRSRGLVKYLVKHDAFASDPVSYVDVGASGGIPELWRLFGEGLIVTGFEPIVRESERLNAARRIPTEEYHCLFVGCPDKVVPPGILADPTADHDNWSLPITSALKFEEITGRIYAQEVFNRQDTDMRQADCTVTLDEFFSAGDRSAVPIDFLKVDTDGSDLQVLLGAERLLADRAVLGIHVETPFHGRTHPYSNTFANIDRFLREQGFTLFSLTTTQYSRHHLPAKFVLPLPAQTQTGQTQFGDALYFRDLADPLYAAKNGLTVGVGKLLKLVAFYALFDLPDCAAQLILSQRSAFEALGIGSVHRWLDRLTPLVDGEKIAYDDYMTRFRTHPESFLASSAASEAAVTTGTTKGLPTL